MTFRESLQNRRVITPLLLFPVIIRGPEPRITLTKGVLSVPFSTAVRISRKGGTVTRVQRNCCALFMRLATISLTALSTDEMDKRFVWRRAILPRRGRPRGEERGLGCKPRQAA